jgi:hypothetical protein
MPKKIIDVILNDGVNKQQFIDQFNNDKVELWNIMESIDNLIVVNIDEDYITEFSNNSQIKNIDLRLFKPIPASLPDFFTTTKTITAVAPSTLLSGSNYMPMQFYLDTDIIYSSQKLGSNDPVSSLNNATYFNRWTGKNVDIVSLEVGPVDATLQGVHATHPDFSNLESPGTPRVIAKNWTDLEDASNNQISSNRVFSSHAMGVLSAAAGTVCGFAKKSNLYVAYLTAEDGEVECINAIISWHNSKPVNPTTGVKNPTIMIAEYQYLVDRSYGIKIDDINSITTPSGTINRPGASWGVDLTPFTSRNIIPFRIQDPNTLNFEWCAVFPYPFQNTALKLALQAAWDAGIVNFNAAGNNGGVYVKDSDPRWNGTFCSSNGSTITRYDISYSSTTIVTATTTNETTAYPFRAYGPHGLDKSIDVAAGQNSETYQILDAYSNRGPGIDIVGLGENTWTAYPQSTYADGNRWGMFSGTSCATPTVVGKAACMMERYYFYNNQWPTNTQIKSILLSEAKSVVENVDSTTWNNRPAASTNYSVAAFAGLTSYVNWIQNNFYSPNGGFRLGELAGTTTKRAFFNAQSFQRNQTQGKRPVSGAAYPRTKIRRFG